MTRQIKRAKKNLFMGIGLLLSLILIRINGSSNNTLTVMPNIEHASAEVGDVGACTGDAGSSGGDCGAGSSCGDGSGDGSSGGDGSS